MDLGSYRYCCGGFPRACSFPILGNSEAKDAGGSSRSCHIGDTIGESGKKVQVIFDNFRELVVIR